jgi:putative flippase GtrA
MSDPLRPVNGEAEAGWRRWRIAREFFRYLWAGGLAFGSDLLVLVALTELAGLNYLVSNVFGFAVGLATSYLLCVRWVFERRRFQAASREFAVFTVVALVGLGINEAVMWGLVEKAGLHYTLAKVLATGFAFVVNFFLRKAVLFR